MRVPVNKELLTGTVSVNNFYHNIKVFYIDFSRIKQYDFGKWGQYLALLKWSLTQPQLVVPNLDTEFIKTQQ